MKIEVVFKYRESCSHVYKKVVFYLNGERVTARKKEIKELLQQDAPKILTTNTYFWTPGRRAKDRRSNEAWRINEVKAWLESKGFRTEYYYDERTGYDVVKGVKEVVEV